MGLQNNSQPFVKYCQLMSIMTLIIMILLVVINLSIWFLPLHESPFFNLGGFSFSLSDGLLTYLEIEPSSLVRWQLLVGIVLSSVPLLVLVMGLWYLYRLFQCYRQGNYFLVTAAVLLGKVGKAVCIWVILNFLAEPLLTLCLTLYQPEKLITLSFTFNDAVILFMAGCIMMIAHILYKASEINTENQGFV